MKKNNELEGALALYLLGMEVANVDGNIDEKEFAMLVDVALMCSLTTKSKFVRESSRLLAMYADPNVHPNLIKEYYESDSRSHGEIIDWVAAMLKKGEHSDRMRYLETARLITGAVAAASGGTMFDRNKVSRGEATIASKMLFALSGGMDPDLLKEWIANNGS